MLSRLLKSTCNFNIPPTTRGFIRFLGSGLCKLYTCIFYFLIIPILVNIMSYSFFSVFSNDNPSHADHYYIEDKIILCRVK